MVAMPMLDLDDHGLAQRVLDAVKDLPWDSPSQIVLIPSDDWTGTAADDLFSGCTRTNPVQVDGRDCPTWTVGDSFEKPWEALIGTENPGWVTAIAIVSESWVAPPDPEGIGRQWVNGVRSSPNRDEARQVEVVTSNAEHGFAAIVRYGTIDPDPWSEGSLLGRGVRFLSRWMQIPSPDPVMPARGVVVTGALNRALQTITENNIRDRTTATELLIAAVKNAVFGDATNQDGEPITWEGLREASATGHGDKDLRRAAAWFDTNGWAEHWIDVAGDLTDMCCRLSPYYGVDVARMVRWILGVDGRAESSERDMFVAETHGDDTLDLDRAHVDGTYRPRTLLGVPISLAQCNLDPGQPLHDQSLDQTLSDIATGEPDIAVLERANRIARSNGRDRYEPVRQPGDVAAVQSRLFDMPFLGNQLFDPNYPFENELGVPSEFTADINPLVAVNAAESFIAAGQSHDMRTWLAGATISAVPYWIDSPTAVAVTGAHLPEDTFGDRLRLPHPSVFVCFETDLAFDDYTRTRIDPLADTPRERLPAYPAFQWGWAGGWGTALGDLSRTGGGLTGVVLFADDDGKPTDRVLWVITTGTDPRESVGRWRTHVLPGWISDAEIGHAALNLAAYLCWGDLQAPDRLDLPPLDDNKGWRKFTRTSQWRKKEPYGAALGVHVVRHQPNRGGSHGEKTGRSTTGHLRRGHWRRSRVGITDPASGEHVGPVNGPESTYGVTYTYRENFIPPAAVAGGPTGDRLDVYRLPTPAHLIEDANSDE